ncbi:MAG: flagellar hook assembly protein FlgD [Polyangiaceae bacterium]
MSDAISSLTTPTMTTGASTAKATGTVDKNEFLKLLVAQLQHQDPTQPTEGTEFVTQLAQFSQVEQAQNQTTQLTSISNQISGLSSNEAANLIGKQVDVRGTALNFDGNLTASTNVTLDAPADKVQVTIKDSSGNVVRTMSMGAEPQGPLNVTWDGKDDSGKTEPAGSYSVAVTATGANGSNVNVESDVKGTVTKLSYDKGYPVVTLDSGITAAISDLVSVAAAPAPSK